MIKKSYFFAGAFLALCIALCWGVWYSMAKLRECREEYDALNSERQNNTAIIASVGASNENLSRLANLSANDYEIAPDAVAFFSVIRPMMESHRINLTYMTTSGQNDAGKKDSILQLRMNCRYYNMAAFFADLRNLVMPSRITRLSIRRNNTLPEELVEADMTIEVMTEE